MASEQIAIDVAEGIATVTLNRPEKLNAMTYAMGQGLFTALRGLGEDDDVRVIRMKGEGRAFCAGGDMSEAAEELADWSSGDAHKVFDGVNEWYGLQWDAIWHNPKPVVAQIHGYCLGEAVELVNACDLVVTSRDAQIGVRVGQLGAVLIAGLPSTLGIRKAREITFTDGTISGDEAAACGFANHAVELEELEQTTLALCQKVAAMPPQVTRFGKLAINRNLEQMGFGGTGHRESWTWLALTLLTHGAGKEWQEVKDREGFAAAMKWAGETFNAPGKTSSEGS